MKKIGIISDTHSYLDDNIFTHFESCDEIWHAGDFGNKSIADQLAAFKPLKGVHGNIDGYDVYSLYPEKMHFTVEQVPVFMQHIGGYPGRYAPTVKNEIITQGSRLFISGHSHILKVMFDEKLQCLHINPGAAGKEGWHKVRTIIRLDIDGANMKNCEVIELGKR